MISKQDKRMILDRMGEVREHVEPFLSSNHSILCNHPRCRRPVRWKITARIPSGCSKGTRTVLSHVCDRHL